MVELRSIPKHILVEDLGLLNRSEGNKQKLRFGIFICVFCCTKFKVPISFLNTGKIKSCGCLNKKHMKSNSKIYSVWENIKQRCYNINNPQYINYGGRGIVVCDEWKNDFKTFHDWAILNGYEENKGLSIDRINNDGNYEPNNCRWTTQNIQQRNTRDLKPTNKSGFRGVSWCSTRNRWRASIKIDSRYKNIGYYTTSLEAGKAYETFVRLNNLEHKFTPTLNEEEILNLNIKDKEFDRNL